MLRLDLRYAPNLATLVLTIAGWMSCATHLSATDYFLTIGGGYDRSGNQASLEANVGFFQQLLTDKHHGERRHDIFFADGDDPAADLQIVREKPDGVIYTATPRSQIDQYINQAAANGTAIANCCVTDPATNGLIWTTSTPEQTGDLATPMAAWVVNDAKQAGNNKPGALYVNLPDYPILSALATGFEKQFKAMCSDCPYQKLDVGLADIQKAPDNIVSALRSNPNLKYVVQSTDSAFTGLPAALKAAGLNDVKIFGEGPGTTNLANIANGAQAGSMAFAVYEIMFGAVDAIARKKAGADVVPGFAPPNWILLKDNLPSSTEFFPLVPDVVNQFKALWGK